MFNAHPINRISKAGAAIVNTISNTIGFGIIKNDVGRLVVPQGFLGMRFGIFTCVGVTSS